MSNALHTLTGIASDMMNTGGGLGLSLLGFVIIVGVTRFINRGKPRSRSMSMEDQRTGRQSDLPVPVPITAPSEGKS